MDLSMSFKNMEFDKDQYQDSAGQTLCKVCNCILTLGSSKESCEANLLNHIKGKKHRNLKSSQLACPDDSKVYDDKYDWEEDLNPVNLMKIGISIINDDILYCYSCKCYLPDYSNKVESIVCNIKKHISGARHAKCSVGLNYSDFSIRRIMQDSSRGIKKLYILFLGLPKQIQFNHKYFVFIDGNQFKCIICNCALFLSENNEKKKLIDHLTGHDHLQQLENISKSNSQSKCRKSHEKIFEPVCINEDCLSDFTNDVYVIEIKKTKFERQKDKYRKNCLTKTRVFEKTFTLDDIFFESVPNELHIHKKYVVNRQNFIVCTLCNILISGLNKYKTAVSSVIAHLASDHHLKLTQYEDSSNSTDCLVNVVYELPASLKFNIVYFKENMNGYIMCFPCAKEFKDLKDISGIEGHLISKKHKNAFKRFKKYAFEGSGCEISFSKRLMLRNVEKKSLGVMIDEVFDQLPLDVKFHKKYITANDSDYIASSYDSEFRCTLCLRNFKVCNFNSLKNCICYHLESTKHLKKFKDASTTETTVPKIQFSVNDLFIKSIPIELQSHKNYIFYHSNNIVCALCNIPISDSKKYNSAVSSIIAHLTDNHHIKLMNFQVSSRSSTRLLKIFEKLPTELMLNGFCFKESMNGSIMCFPCAKEFKDLHDINDIKGHLICEKHKNALKRFKKYAVEDFKSEFPFDNFLVSRNNEKKSVEVMIAEVFDEFLSDMKCHKKFISPDDSEGFIKCSLCLRNLKILNLNSLKHSIYHHLKSTKHLKKFRNANKDESAVPKSQTGLNDLFVKSIPNELQVHQRHIVYHVNYIVCTLCNIRISSLKRYDMAVSRVIAHLTDNHHLKLWKFLDGFLMNYYWFFEAGHQLMTWYKLSAQLMFHGFYVKENMYPSIMCFPCAKEFKDLNNIKSIEGHIISEKHKCALKRFKNHCVEDYREKIIAAIFRRYPQLNEDGHKNYIVPGDSEGTFKCTLCVRNIEIFNFSSVSVREKIYLHVQSEEHLAYHLLTKNEAIV